MSTPKYLITSSNQQIIVRENNNTVFLAPIETVILQVNNGRFTLKSLLGISADLFGHDNIINPDTNDAFESDEEVFLHYISLRTEAPSGNGSSGWVS